MDVLLTYWKFLPIRPTYWALAGSGSVCVPIVTLPNIKHVRAFTVRGGGADYHDQGEGHWIDDHIATPMSR